MGSSSRPGIWKRWTTVPGSSCRGKSPFQIRACTATAYSAGGKTKDGFFAQVVNGDEYGSAAYVKGRCDMSNLMNVMCSSMGPRREPLRLITTTAGHAIQGPFHNELEGVKQLLENEMNYETA